ncbi:MAG: phosphatidylserine decarboxylase family protein [Candidatus Babeliaceae bacterium]
MFEFFSTNLIWSQGQAILLIIALIALLGFFSRFFLIFALCAFIFSLYFFRNPLRSCPAALTDSTIIVCPADGKVVDVAPYTSDSSYNFTQKVSIFLSPIDVHVNWIPFTGTIEKMEYVPGKFLMAFLPKSSELNEHHDIVIRNGEKVLLVRQIAGIIARRICWWINEGQTVQQGQTYGMIRFGSRVDILLPSTAQVAVQKGERVYGGQTILARWE